MSCRDFDTAILDMGRGAPLAPETERATLAHLEHCAVCRRQLERARTLTNSLRALAAATPGLAEPERMERRLVAQIEALASKAETTSANAPRWRPWLAAAAAVVFVSGLAIGWRVLQTPPARLKRPLRRRTGWPGRRHGAPGLRERRARAHGAARFRAAAAGFHVAQPAREGRVAADVVYGQDGEARAVRLVMTDSNRP